MRLAFCESLVLKAWLDRQVADKTHRELRSDIKERITHVHRYLEHLRAQGFKLACTITGAAYVITEFYKGTLPFSGGSHQLMIRKSYAREVARIIQAQVVLLAVTPAQFGNAENLWWRWCDRGQKAGFAGFADYLDTALILAPAEGVEIAHVIVHHEHLPYILKASRFAGLVHHLRSSQ